MDTKFKAINDPTRREILQFLVNGPQNAGQIASQFDMSKPSISHHLDLLKQANLIQGSHFRNFLAVPEQQNQNFQILGDFTPVKSIYRLR